MLNGAFIFTADLVRHIQPLCLEMRVDFIRASSYGSSAISDGFVEVEAGDTSRFKGWHVLLVSAPAGAIVGRARGVHVAWLPAVLQADGRALAGG